MGGANNHSLLQTWPGMGRVNVITAMYFEANRRLRSAHERVTVHQRNHMLCCIVWNSNLFWQAVILVKNYDIFDYHRFICSVLCYLRLLFHVLTFTYENIYITRAINMNWNVSLSRSSVVRKLILHNISIVSRTTAHNWNVRNVWHMATWLRFVIVD